MANTKKVPLPYSAGNPVGNSDAFVGRIDILNKVQQILNRPNSNGLILYGQRRIGKSSILQRLKVWLKEMGSYTPIYFDLQDKINWNLEQLVKSLMSEIIRELNLLPPSETRDDFTTYFNHEWLPDVLRNLPPESSLVFLFDEFDVIANIKTTEQDKEKERYNFFRYLKNLLTNTSYKVKCIFVIGRNIDDLNAIAYSIFKEYDIETISLLSKSETTKIIRLSEANNTLQWSDEAVDYVYTLTNGHPLLTQQLCMDVWEYIHYDSDKIVIVGAKEIEAVIDITLRASGGNFELLWDALPSAARIVTSALAQSNTYSVSEEKLIELLEGGGLLVGDLLNAPIILQKWDIIEILPDTKNYYFKVELFRRWVAKFKQLAKVRDESRYLVPIAEDYYKLAKKLTDNPGKTVEDVKRAIEFLQEALILNSNLTEARLLLADLYLIAGLTNEALDLIEQLHRYQPSSAYSRLINILLIKISQTADEDIKLQYFEQILAINPNQLDALDGKKKIWKQRAESAFNQNNLEEALHAFQEAGYLDKVKEIEEEINLRAFNAQTVELEKLIGEDKFIESLNFTENLFKKYPTQTEWYSSKLAFIKNRFLETVKTNILKLESEQQYFSALAILDNLLQEVPEFTVNVDLTEIEDRLKHKSKLNEMYQEAIKAFDSNRKKLAKKIFLEIINLEPNYEDTIIYLVEIIKGIDIKKLQELLNSAQENLAEINQGLIQTNDKLVAEYQSKEVLQREFALLQLELKQKSEQLDETKILNNTLNRQKDTLNIEKNTLIKELANRKSTIDDLREEIQKYILQIESMNKIPKLSIFNPLHYLYIWLWAILFPEKLGKYSQIYGKSDIYILGSVVLSSIFILPFVIISGVFHLPEYGTNIFPFSTNQLLSQNLIFLLLTWVSLGLVLIGSELFRVIFPISLILLSSGLILAVGYWEGYILLSIMVIFSSFIMSFLNPVSNKTMFRFELSPLKDDIFLLLMLFVVIIIFIVFVSNFGENTLMGWIFALVQIVVGSFISSMIILGGTAVYTSSDEKRIGFFSFICLLIMFLIWIFYFGGYQWLR